MTLTSNRKTGLSRKRILIHGPPASSKTFKAASSDAKFKLDNKRWVKLDKTIWVPIDEGATSGLLEHKVEVPEVNVREILAEYTVIKAINLICEEVESHVKEGMTIVVDTVSALDDLIMDHYQMPEHMPTTRDNKRDSYALQRYVLATHSLFKQRLFELPCSLIMLCHSKPLTSDANTTKKTQAQAPSGIVSRYSMDVYYNAVRNIYRKHCDIIWAARVKRTTIQGKGESKQYQLVSDSSEADGFETKCRFQKYVKPVETDDLHKIFTRIEQAIK